jgi:hypothetical protein
MTLSDLDELVQSVRDTTSRSYLREAVAAYRAMAHRAAVVATWIAVTFDIIAKIRELAAQGDAKASMEIGKIDAAIASGNPQQVQAIESNLLTLAESFEFLGPREKTDLERLRDDRNHCAHPAFVQVDSLFVPTSELVRTHIVHAVHHLLAHPPVQGRVLLERIKIDLLQPSFPTDRSSAVRYFTEKYCQRVKKGLPETMVKVLLKALITKTDADLVGKEKVVGHCLAALAQAKLGDYPDTVKAQLRHLTDKAADDTLRRVFYVLAADPNAWQLMDDPLKTRLKGIVMQQPSDSSFVADDEPQLLRAAFEIPDLVESANQVFAKLDAETQQIYIAKAPGPEFCEQALKLFSEAKGYRSAESLAQSCLLPMAPYMSAEGVLKALAAVESNGQIWNAVGIPDLLAEWFDGVRRHFTACRDGWKKLLEFVKSVGEEEGYSSLRRKFAAAAKPD